MSVEQLNNIFEIKQVKGWLTAYPKPPFTLSGFSSSRLGKIVDGIEFQFSIGATKLGAAHNLNSTIQKIIQREGITALKRYSTDGSIKPKKEYPSLILSDLTVSQFDRIINQVLGAITQIQNEVST